MRKIALDNPGRLRGCALKQVSRGACQNGPEISHAGCVTSSIADPGDLVQAGLGEGEEKTAEQQGQDKGRRTSHVRFSTPAPSSIVVQRSPVNTAGMSSSNAGERPDHSMATIAEASVICTPDDEGTSTWPLQMHAASQWLAQVS